MATYNNGPQGVGSQNYDQTSDSSYLNDGTNTNGTFGNGTNNANTNNGTLPQNRGYGVDDDISKKSEEPYSGYDVEKMESERQGSVYRPVLGEDSKYKVLNKWQASLIYITNQVGIGILSLPVAMQTLGLIPCIICIIGMGILVTYTAYVLLQFFRRYPTVLNCVDCFRIIGGKWCALVVGIAFVLNLILTCSSSVITMSIALNSLSEHATCTVVFILVPTIFSWFICMPRRMKFMADFGMICTISIFVAVLIVMIALGVAEPNGAPPGFDKEINLVGNPSFAQGFTAVLNIAFAYAGNQAFVTVMAEMRDPSKDFMPSMYILQIFAIPMYTIVGAVIYALAGQYVTSPALGTAPPIPSKVAYGLLLPTLMGTSLVFGHTSIKYIFIEALRYMKAEDEYDQNTKRSWILWLGIGTVFWVLAFILANAIPLFNSILSVSSALFVSWFTFGISGVMWIHLNWGNQFANKRKTAVALLNWAIVLMTVFMTTVGLWASIDQLIEAFNDPDVPVNSSFTCADNSIWRQLGIDT
ncbi:amino acid transporter [Dendryphion nanum]|uniref:Amino acid transporter n=1 Tax=Dendryphion nanum TaxID=256645 RepID=A0A9P9EKL6_9PLEO|nr:amino acid transporter [Dendryphion nanum]